MQIGRTRFEMGSEGTKTVRLMWPSQFLARGYKVGRVDQCETALGAEMKRAKDKEKEGKGTGKAPAKDKLVGRELKSVLTSATLVDGIVEDLSKHCVAIKVCIRAFVVVY